MINFTTLGNIHAHHEIDWPLLTGPSYPPENPVPGMMYYDIENQQIMIYNTNFQWEPFEIRIHLYLDPSVNDLLDDLKYKMTEIERIFELADKDENVSDALKNLLVLVEMLHKK